MRCSRLTDPDGEERMRRVQPRLSSITDPLGDPVHLDDAAQEKQTVAEVERCPPDLRAGLKGYRRMARRFRQGV